MWRTRRGPAALTVVCLAMSGCTGPSLGGDKAGGTKPATVILRMVSTPSSLSDTPPVADFVKRVTDLSHGAMRVQVIDQWGDYAPDDEAKAVRAVASGSVSLGWAGSRVFDSLGVRGLQALTAPMLVDSYSLENAILASDIPRRMLDELNGAGVAGLGILGDGLRRPISVHGPLLSWAAWKGISFGTYLSDVQDEAVRALGALPVHTSGPLRSHALMVDTIQGFELDIRRYDALGLATQAPYVAANITLWPQFDVLFANPRQLASLTGQQRTWLERAAHDAAVQSIAVARETTTNIRAVCAKGARFAEASPADLTAMWHAMSGVYQQIERYDQTKLFIQQIQDLKRLTAPDRGLLIPAGCAIDR